MRSRRVWSEHLLRRDTPHHHRHRLLHPPLPAPSNQLNGLHFTDVIKETNYHRLVIYPTHEGRQPRPGTRITKSVSTLGVAHCLLCLFADEPGSISQAGSFTQSRRSDSRSFVGASGQSNKSPVFSSVGERGGRWKCYQTPMGLFSIQAALKQNKTSLQEEPNTPLQ